MSGVSAAKDVGVQTYPFRETQSHAELAKKVREIGLDKVELYGIRVAYDKPEKFGETVQTYAAEGVKIVSVGPFTFSGHENERKWFECANVAGAKYLSAGFRIDTYQTAIPMAARWCEELGIKLAIQGHGGYVFGGSLDQLDYLLKLGGENVGICLDTGWCMQLGPDAGNPVKWVEHFGRRIFGVHYKDLSFARDARWTEEITGEGNLNLPAFIKALDHVGFDGYAVIEYDGAPSDPLPGYKKCTAAIRSA